MATESTLESFFEQQSPICDSGLTMQGAGEAENPLLESKCANLMNLIDRARKITVDLLFPRSQNGYFLTVTRIYHNTNV